MRTPCPGAFTSAWKSPPTTRSACVEATHPLPLRPASHVLHQGLQGAHRLFVCSCRSPQLQMGLPVSACLPPASERLPHVCWLCQLRRPLHWPLPPVSPRPWVPSQCVATCLLGGSVLCVSEPDSFLLVVKRRLSGIRLCVPPRGCGVVGEKVSSQPPRAPRAQPCGQDPCLPCWPVISCLARNAR